MEGHRIEVITEVYFNICCQSKTFKKTSIPPFPQDRCQRNDQKVTFFLKELEMMTFEKHLLNLLN